MGLLSSYNNDNKIVTQGKTISYSQSYVRGDWSYYLTPSQMQHYDYAWCYTRNCQMSLKYVGMDYATAKQCAADMISTYTRQFKISDWDDATGTFSEVVGGNIPMAQCAVIQRAGDMYDVVVNVSEQDSRLRISAVNDPASLFTDENNRTYND